MTSQLSPAILDLIEADCAAGVGRAFVALAAEYFEQTRTREGRVSTAHTPAGLAARFDEPLPRDGQSVEAVIARLRADVIPDCNRLFHPRYVGHQVSAPLPIAVWMESVTAALNQSTAVFEMSPVGTVLEHRVVRWMCELAGYPADAGGTMTTGGTEATFTALLAARNVVLPDAWTNGVGNDPPVLLCGEHTHYAVTRAAGELGVGMRHAIAVKSRDHKMDPDALRLALAALAREGRRVLAVVATAGSTATGSFDDLETIAAICDEHDVWLHVDGAHGASALLSRAHRHRVRGIERARSIAWDPHKMMLLPLQAGMVLVRNEHDLDAAFSQRAPYLFQSGDAAERVWDQGTRSFLCSHRADVFKLWVALQRYGATALGELYDHLCANARLVWEQIQERPDFEALHEPESNILCFRYVGRRDPERVCHPERSEGSLSPERDPSVAALRQDDTVAALRQDDTVAALRQDDTVAALRQDDTDRALRQDDTALDAINRELRERYNLTGEGWITATNLDGRRVLRVTMMNPRTTASDITDVLDGLAAIGKTL